VQVAPGCEQRHGPPERARAATRDGTLDEQRTDRKPDERHQVRTWQRARLDDPNPREKYGGRRDRRRALACRSIHEGEGRRDEQRLEYLHPCAAGRFPQRIQRRVEQPRRVPLPVAGVVETERVRANDVTGEVFTSLRQVIPEIRLVDGSETEDRRGAGDEQDHRSTPVNRGKRHVGGLYASFPCGLTDLPGYGTFLDYSRGIS
jgi:hypothetical protein